jgi:hypothetical protein
MFNQEQAIQSTAPSMTAAATAKLPKPLLTDEEEV